MKMIIMMMMFFSTLVFADDHSLIKREYRNDRGGGESTCIIYTDGTVSYSDEMEEIANHIKVQPAVDVVDLEKKIAEVVAVKETREKPIKPIHGLRRYTVFGHTVRVISDRTWLNHIERKSPVTTNIIVETNRACAHAFKQAKN